MYVAAVIPTIDEAETIGPLVQALDKFCDEVIVVDGSATDETREAAKAAGAMVSDQTKGPSPLQAPKQGLGPAYARGHWRIPREWYVLHIDAGGSHDPADAYPMLDLADEGFDVVIGSRFCPGGKHQGKLRRRLSSRAAAGALNLISFLDISDWTSGYRVYSPAAREVLRNHEFATVGHAWQIEALWVCNQHGLRVVEHPITYKPSPSRLSAHRVGEAARLYGRLVRE